MSAAEKLAEDIEARLNGKRRNPDDIIENGTVKIVALIARANRYAEARNYERVIAARPLRPPTGPLPERYVAPGRIEAAKARRAEVRIEILNGRRTPYETGES